MANLFSIGSIQTQADATILTESLKRESIPGANELGNLIYDLQQIIRVTGAANTDPIGQKVVALSKFYDDLSNKLDAEIVEVKARLNYNAGGNDNRNRKIPSEVIGKIAAANVAKAIEKEILYSEALYPLTLTQSTAISKEASDNITRLLERARTSQIVSGVSALKRIASS